MKSFGEIAKKLRKAGLDRVTDAVRNVVRPSIRLKLGDSSADAVARLGGLPNLPTEFEWPARRDGNPLSFIAQIDLSQLQPVEGLPLPGEGTLFFFMDSVDIPAGYDPGDNDGFKVIFSKATPAENAARATSRYFPEECVFEGFALEPELELTLPAWSHDSFAELELNDDESDAYHEQFDIEGTINRIGGYPDTLQDSLELTAELVSHGIYCGDGRGFEEGRRRKLGPGAADWRLLLQIDSEGDVGMMWGDAGRIFFLIREEDLREGRFDRVHAEMQCG
jgi:uncharacterized protein YwqG